MKRQARKIYKERGFAASVGFGKKPALLIIDFINGFTDSNCPLGSNFDFEVDSTAKLLSIFRKKSLPVHFTTTVYDEKLISAGVFSKKIPSLSYLREGSKWVLIDDRLKPEEGEVVWVKHYASAFFGTSLSSALRTQNVDTLVITGCTTSGCVRASAVDSCQHGFHTIVVRDCVGDRLRSAHEANLFDLDAKYADVLAIQDVIKYLENHFPSSES
ncbi:MAG: isochorismatase family protein [Pyrinomonadaceae bacterium]|nr:isochorismatase family protein [Pyrinomonadaceae bacterium]MCX7639616.1 isochorismatase family protein [Pyrinomonadaceae bacterium]MDW8303366.1 isochorismatase family protein [Acidobacteriota bacterium]